jgi:hypothetical protein
VKNKLLPFLYNILLADRNEIPVNGKKVTIGRNVTIPLDEENEPFSTIR